MPTNKDIFNREDNPKLKEFGKKLISDFYKNADLSKPFEITPSETTPETYYNSFSVELEIISIKQRLDDLENKNQFSFIIKPTDMEIKEYG